MKTVSIFLFLAVLPFIVTGQVIIGPDAKMTIGSGAKLETTGTVGFIIKSTSTGTGSFVDENSASSGYVTIAGTTTVERYMTGNWVSGLPTPTTEWHEVSSPTQNPSNIVFDGSLMNKWNEATQNWDPMTLPYENMLTGKGYIVAPLNPAVTASYTGNLNTGDQTISGLTKTGTSTWAGFNLIGNPFSSAIHWNSDVTLSNVANYAWLWNGGAYIAKDQSTGDGIIPSGQGFFIQVTSGTGSVTLPASLRFHSSQAFYKSTIVDLLTLKIEGNGYWDETQVRIRPEATGSYDVDHDALKFPGSDASPQLFTYKNDLPLSIMSLPTLTVYPVVQIGLKPGTQGTFTLTASGIETFAPGSDLYLEDLLTNDKQDLTINPVYAFTAEPGQPEYRFNLHFAPMGVAEQESEGIRIYAVNKDIHVSMNQATDGDIIVYDLLGRETGRQRIERKSHNILRLDLTSGLYIVTITGYDKNCSEKVYIR